MTCGRPGQPGLRHVHLGSTGHPRKLSPLAPQRGGIVRRLEWSSWFQDRDVWAWCHSPAFDFSVWELWGALLTVGGLWWCPATVRSPRELWQLVLHQRDYGAQHPVSVL